MLTAQIFYKSCLPIKRLLISFLIFVLLLSSCSLRPSESASYSPITLKENISLPIPSSDISDTAQLGNCLYILGNGGVYSQNLETGESLRLFDSDCKYINAYGGMLHLFLPEKGCFFAYTPDGEPVNELYLEDFKKPEPNGFKGFAVSDGFYIFATENGSSGMNYTLADRNSGEIKTLKAPKNIRRLCSYKDEKVLAICYSVSAADCAVWELDLNTEKSSKLGDINDMYILLDLAYNPRADSVLMSACGSDMQICISEFALDSGECSVISKPKLQANGMTKCNVSVSENIAFLITDLDENYFFYDYERPPQSLTLAYFGVQNVITDFIREFENKTGVIVKTIHYDKEQVGDLNIKLMAGDSDIDCFCTDTLRKFAYITNNQFADLYNFPELKEKIRSDPFIEQVSAYDGLCFGVPYDLKFYPEGSTPYDNLTEDTVKYLEDLRLEGKFFYLRNEQLSAYIRKNIDLESMTYSDADGEEFYSLMKNAVESAGETDSLVNYKDIPYVYAERPYVEAEYIMMSPTSEKKELAASFLAEFFDYISAGEGSKSQSFPETSESVEGLQIEWRYDDYTVCEPLYETFNGVFEPGADLSDKSLREVAKKASAEVAMRIGE